VAAPPRASPDALGRAHDGHAVALVEPQELRQRELEPGGDPAGDGQRRARLAALDLAEHLGRDAAALGQVAQGEVHRLAERAHANADLKRLGGEGIGAHPAEAGAVADDGWHPLYAITDIRPPHGSPAFRVGGGQS
jgi:hypothetical protein